MLILIITGVLVQLAYGYYQFDLDVYAGTLFGSALSVYVIYTMLAMFIHVMVNNKFLGFTICVVFITFIPALDSLGLEHDLWHFASGTLGGLFQHEWIRAFH
ncbi:MAG: hypothetical protein WDN75_20025 [Bacteroidota bacterium]